MTKSSKSNEVTGRGLTKVQFANICNGTLLQNQVARYRLVERLCRKLVLSRVSAVASAPLTLIVGIGERDEWEMVD